MNFIRNIISEKRAARPVAPPMAAAPGEADFGASTLPDQLDAAVTARAEPFEFAEASGDSARLNIFASEEADGDAAPVNWDLTPSDAEARDLAPLRLTHPKMAADPQVEPSAPETPVAFFEQPAPEAARQETIEERKSRFAILSEEPAQAKSGAEAAPEPLSIAHGETSNPLTLSDMPFVSVQPLQQGEEMLTDAGIQVPPPAAGRGANRSGRVKTRLLGFNPDSLGLANPFEKAESRADDPFPVAWLVVVAGPGLGASFALHDGVSKIGRGDDQTVCLNFGDNSISRENHVSIAYDSEQNALFIGQSGRSNIVRLNNKPLLSTEQMRSGDQVRIGETTLRLVALCGDDFSWAAKS